MKYSDVTAIILCAGSGTRAKLGYNKMFFTLDSGKTVLDTALSAFKDFENIILVINKEDEERFASLNLPLVYGGSSRSESVINALGKVSTPYVLIHDGARPFVTSEIIEDSVKNAKLYGSGVCAVTETNSLKVRENGNTYAVNRDNYYIIQTPQTFDTQKLKHAYSLNTFATDDSEIFEKAGYKVTLSMGDYANKKLTSPSDFAPSSFKIGHGFDVHQLVENRKLILGGIEIPHDKGLLGHSDADALIHAIMDALLSASCKRDIGCLFPDSDNSFKDIDSKVLLKKVMQEIKPYTPVNISAVIMAQKPKMAPHIDKMRATLASIMELNIEDINISATTTEKLGIVGEEKGIACSAVALLCKQV
ncbi:MAG: 2-C-methyl-D-erythritol 2,4-cyclodiphosphate synthase [Clostridiales bacterium]|nr:2-C-methyl-D-erythritol 2,4-cyclodiphosphate synthase [Clostridiales bacterium]